MIDIDFLFRFLATGILMLSIAIFHLKVTLNPSRREKIVFGLFILSGWPMVFFSSLIIIWII